MMLAGDWSFHPETEEEDGDEETAQQDEGEEYAYLDDEDADRDESSDSDSSDSQDDGTLQRVRALTLNCLLKKIKSSNPSPVIDEQQ